MQWKRGIFNQRPRAGSNFRNELWAAPRYTVSWKPLSFFAVRSNGWERGLLTPVIHQRREKEKKKKNKPRMEAGWLMLDACGFPAHKHVWVIGKNLRMSRVKWKQWHVMTCPVAEPQCIVFFFFHSHQWERLWLCAKHTTLAITYSSLIKITTRTNKEKKKKRRCRLVDSKSCHIVKCREKKEVPYNYVRPKKKCVYMDSCKKLT